ncbi:MAG: PaaI family thioesterase [Bacteroidales bacterium]|nr:PaaI family thioesterase [Bacteroidales bacterium]
MRKIHNAWAGTPNYNCFGCCPTNPSGLRMEFYEDGDDIVSLWQPTYDTQGWINVLHGGIQATLADEIASWVVFRKLQTSGVTVRLDVRYRKSININDGRITLRAKLSGVRRNLADIEVKIFDANGVLCTEVSAVYFTSNEQQAKEMGFVPFELEEVES